MKRIWIIVFGSVLMCFVFGMMWHFSIMRELGQSARQFNNEIKANIIVLSAYRDVLRDEGIEAARVHLAR